LATKKKKEKIVFESCPLRATSLLVLVHFSVNLDRETEQHGVGWGSH
jgi:hypothetical protein